MSDWAQKHLAGQTGCAQLEAAPDTPTVVAMHHPPFTTGIRHMDDMGLREGADELEALIRQHPQVERILCGHLHRPITRRFGGTVAMTAPSPAHQITLDLTPDDTPSFIFEPPASTSTRCRPGTW